MKLSSYSCSIQESTVCQLQSPHCSWVAVELHWIVWNIYCTSLQVPKTYRHRRKRSLVYWCFSCCSMVFLLLWETEFLWETELRIQLLFAADRSIFHRYVKRPVSDVQFFLVWALYIAVALDALRLWFVCICFCCRVCFPSGTAVYHGVSSPGRAFSWGLGCPFENSASVLADENSKRDWGRGWRSPCPKKRRRSQ